MLNRAVFTRRGRAQGALGAAAAVAALAVVMALPSGASAATVRCAGEVTNAAEHVPGFEDEANALDYSFFCNESIKAFSWLTTSEVGYFSPEVTSEPTEENPVANNLSCEGTMPGSGFGCRALGSTNEVKWNQPIHGKVITTKDPCPKFKGQESTRFWITATTSQLTVTGSTFITSSEPQRLKNSIDCPKPKPKPDGKKGRGGGKKSSISRKEG